MTTSPVHATSDASKRAGRKPPPLSQKCGDNGDDDSDDDRKPAAKPNRKRKHGDSASFSSRNNIVDNHNNSSLERQLQEYLRKNQQTITTPMANNSESSIASHPETPTTWSPEFSALRHVVVSTESEETRSRNKAMLFRLFGSYDSKRLDRLAQESSAPSLSSLMDGSKKQDKSNGSKLDENGSSSNSSTSASVMTFMPNALSSFVNDQQHPELNNLLPVRRPNNGNVACKQMQDLEAETCAWHASHRGDNDDKSSSSKYNQVRCLTLQFTECSVVSIARWSANMCRQETTTRPTAAAAKRQRHASGGDSSSNSSIHATNKRPYRPAVDVKFRKCCLCQTWGHYEVDCPSQSSQERFRFVRAMLKSRGRGSSPSPSSPAAADPQNQSGKDNPTIDANNSVDKDYATATAKDDDDDDDDEESVDEITIEKCRGFLIEQRKKPPGQESDEEGPSHANNIKNRKRRREEAKESDVTELDGLVIKATSIRPVTATTTADPNDEPKQQLLEGDLVAWFDEEASSTAGDRTVLAGVVADCRHGATTALVRCLRTIPHTPIVGVNRDVGSSKHVPINRLVLLEDLYKDDDETLVSSPSGRGTRVSVNQMRRRGLKMKRDGSMNPKNAPRLLGNGTFVQPAGCNPYGLEWDEKRGVWIRKQES